MLAHKLWYSRPSLEGLTRRPCPITKERQHTGPPAGFRLGRFVSPGMSRCRLADFGDLCVGSHPCFAKSCLYCLGISVHTYEGDANRSLTSCQLPASVQLWKWNSVEEEDTEPVCRVRLSPGFVSELACPIRSQPKRLRLLTCSLRGHLNSKCLGKGLSGEGLSLAGVSSDEEEVL